MANRTVKIENQGNTQFIAHRGLSGIYTENSVAAFSAAAKGNYYGIETDVHPTADGEFVVIHDDTTNRVGNKSIDVERSPLSLIREIILNKKYGLDTECHIPIIDEYIECCKRGGKKAVIELKNRFSRSQIFELCERIDNLGYLESCIFISFDFQNLFFIRMKYPKQELQYLVNKDYFGLILRLKIHKIDLDIKHGAVNRELIEKCHRLGIKVNCWTVDNPDTAKKLISYGVDFITTNILEPI